MLHSLWTAPMLLLLLLLLLLLRLLRLRRRPPPTPTPPEYTGDVSGALGIACLLANSDACGAVMVK